MARRQAMGQSSELVANRLGTREPYVVSDLHGESQMQRANLQKTRKSKRNKPTVDHLHDVVNQLQGPLQVVHHIQHSKPVPYDPCGTLLIYIYIYTYIEREAHNAKTKAS